VIDYARKGDGFYYAYCGINAKPGGVRQYVAGRLNPKQILWAGIG
jgi:hypothetical protein